MASTNHFQCMFLALLFVLGVFSSQASSRLFDEQTMLEKHEQWMAHHGRVYKDVKEKDIRFQIFKENVERINAFNEGVDQGYKLSVNQFADQTNEEFRASRNGYKRQSIEVMSVSKPTSFRYANVTVVPSIMDWRKKGAVTPVKDQGQCGVDQGCYGGLMDSAFQFIKQNKGLTTEANYPYVGQDGTCNSKKAATPAAKITGYEDVPSNNEKALLQAVANHPVSVAIEASGYNFQFYSSGIFTGTCGTNLDHGVTAVGYGAIANGTKYWLVKNSWGSGWGENGYIRMKKDIAAKEGLCGIAMKASYPIV
ncbi:Senescence-specific cysteine protease SAG12 [Camellia lanceoleosa]|uniref:Senescence-specific cysteine protease SAG12 n=1 Tax=Camellia lanceoleosa TaxID=1840588 RepID=A0ACC0GL82_9ERIC|nr:Senescence-specific cysteine protease SAG12 [Camellia lanceoleosa]